MIKQSTSRRELMQFSSLLEVTDFLRTAPRKWGIESSRKAARPDWDLGVGYDGALKLARDGWEHGVRKLAALAGSVPNAVTYEHRYGVAGERPDVPRYLAGDPYNMVHRGKARKPKPAMTIAFNVSAVYGTDANAIWNFGAALVALVDRLESRHVRVEVIGCWGIDFPDKRLGFSWTVKRAEDPLDLSAMAFSMAHPAMMRRLGFAVAERSDLRQDSGYGRPGNGRLTPDDFVDIAEGALFIRSVGMSGNAECRTMEGALAFAKAAINAAAGEDIVELEDYEDA